MKRLDEREIDEDLAELERKIHRLRLEYDQYFMGNGRREPNQLRSEVQKLITRYASDPPRNTQQKFKFNALVARFQALRALWGRTLREIEAGTYRGLRFRARLQDLKAGADEAGDEGQAGAADEAGPGGGAKAAAGSPGPDRREAASGDPMDRLIEAFASARTKTGEGAQGIDRQRIAEKVREQARVLKERHPNAKVRFKVVIDGDRARLKATVR